MKFYVDYERSECFTGFDKEKYLKENITPYDIEEAINDVYTTSELIELLDGWNNPEINRIIDRLGKEYISDHCEVFEITGTIKKIEEE